MDVVISFDSTGSMYPCLAEAKRKISDVVTALFTQYTDLRVGIIAHGDYCDTDTYITKSFQLSNKRDDIVAFVNTVERTGGGDSDECYELVLKEVQSFDWREDHQKLFIMVGDADPHAVGYVYGKHRNMIDWKTETKALAASGVTIYPVKCLSHSRSGFWNTLATLGNGKLLELHQFTDILRLISALVYKTVSNERVQQYREELQLEGTLNRNLASIIDSLLGVTTIEIESASSELREVNPTRFQVLHVDHNCDIKSFVLSTGAAFKVGRGFYELTKPEEVQERKEIVLRDKVTGDMFSGKAARDLVGLPFGVRGKLKPQYGFKYDVFVQSTSSNRKLIGGTRFLYESS